MVPFPRHWVAGIMGPNPSYFEEQYVLTFRTKFTKKHIKRMKVYLDIDEMHVFILKKKNTD